MLKYPISYTSGYDDGTLSQKSYQPYDSAITETLRYKQTDRQTDIQLLYVYNDS